MKLLVATAIVFGVLLGAIGWLAGAGIAYDWAMQPARDAEEFAREIRNGR